VLNFKEFPYTKFCILVYFLIEFINASFQITGTSSPPSRNRNFNNSDQITNLLASNHTNSNNFRASLSTPTLHLHTNGSSHLNYNNHHHSTNLHDHHNIFDVDEQNEDIMKAAAQRDQQRGAGRHIRGMMGPVLGKEVL